MGFFDALTIVTAVLVVLLACAGAGLLRMLRETQHELRLVQRSGSSAAPSRATLDESLVPRDGATMTVAMLMSPGCPVCEEVQPIFDAETSSLEGRVDAVLVSWQDVTMPASSHARTIADTAVYRSLDPGYAPALVMIDERGNRIATEPAGSPEAVRTVLAQVASRVGV